MICLFGGILESCLERDLKTFNFILVLYYFRVFLQILGMIGMICTFCEKKLSFIYYVHHLMIFNEIIGFQTNMIINHSGLDTLQGKLSTLITPLKFMFGIFMVFVIDYTYKQN